MATPTSPMSTAPVPTGTLPSTEQRLPSASIETSTAKASEIATSSAPATALTTTTRTWDDFFEALVQYKEKEGHCAVPLSYEEDPELGKWVAEQRKHRNTMKYMHNFMLNRLNFTWGQQSSGNARKMSYTSISNTSTSSNKNINSTSSSSSSINYISNNSSINKSRNSSTNKSSNNSTNKSSNSINKVSNGNNNINKNCNGNSIRSSSTNKRSKSNKRSDSTTNKISESNNNKSSNSSSKNDINNSKSSSSLRVRETSCKEGLENSKNGESEQWERMYDRYRTYVRARDGTTVDPALDLWIDIQRGKFKKGELSADQIEKLNYIGWNKKPSEQKIKHVAAVPSWDAMFDKMSSFQKTYGHCMVPAGWRPDPSLAQWVTQQRQAFSHGLLARERIDKLTTINFIWMKGKRKRKPAAADIVSALGTTETAKQDTVSTTGTNNTAKPDIIISLPRARKVAKPDTVAIPQATKAAKPDTVSITQAIEAAKPDTVSITQAIVAAKPDTVSIPPVLEAVKPDAVPVPGRSKSAKPDAASIPGGIKSAKPEMKWTINLGRGRAVKPPMTSNMKSKRVSLTPPSFPVVTSGMGYATRNAAVATRNPDDVQWQVFLEAVERTSQDFGSR